MGDCATCIVDVVVVVVVGEGKQSMLGSDTQRLGLPVVKWQGKRTGRDQSIRMGVVR